MFPVLPACLLHARDKTVACHLAELDAAESELAHIASRTAGEGAAVVKPARAGVLRELVKGSPVPGLFESLPLLGIFGN